LHTFRRASFDPPQALDVASLEPLAQCFEAAGCIVEQVAKARMIQHVVVQAIAAEASEQNVQRVSR
jgi:hypothetical protein